MRNILFAMKMKPMKFLLRAALAMILGACLSAQASTIGQPDAGQTSRELQKQPELNPPKAVAPLRSKVESTPSSTANDSMRIAVKAIHVSGSRVYPASELEALVVNLIGGDHTFAELEAGVARITAYYREHGYVVARAYLPAQDIKDGVIVINVLEGLVGQQRINNQSRLSDDLANGYLSSIKSGDVLQSRTVDRALLLLNDTPGVGGARATLQPGASVGTSDLLIELDPSAPYTANVELDNYGNRYTGEYRLGAVLGFNSPLKKGDQLIVRALVSDQHMSYARIAYQIPLGSSGLHVGAAYSDTRYKLGQEFSGLQARGSAISSSLYAVHPFIRSQPRNLSGTLTWEDKKLNDQTGAPISSVDKHVQLANFGLNGNRQDALGGGGINSFDLSLVSGNLSMDPTSLVDDSKPNSAHSNGSFVRFTYNLSRLQRLTETDMLSLALSGQQADKNLNSSEKFSLGGANGVRAYPQGEGSGDEGWLVNLEFRRGFNDALQGVIFYDAGSVTINRNPFAVSSNNRTLTGAGFGTNANFSGLQLKAYLAWHGSGGQPTSEPAAINHSPRVWVQAGKQF